MKRFFTFLMLALLLCGTEATAQNKLKFAGLFGNGMVLQRGEKVPVWGWADAGAAIEVSFAGKTCRTKANTNGEWKVYLPKMKANATGQTLTVKSTATDGKEMQKTLSDVLVGDVFLGSGQSNMELPVRRCMDVVKEDVVNYSNRQIRYLKLPHQYNYVKPNADVQTKPWQDITPENCGEVSGICYFMARQLQESNGVPVGVINSAVGGTQVQAWMPRDVLSTFKGYDKILSAQKFHQQNWPDSVARAEQKAIRQWSADMNKNDMVLNRWNKEGYDFSTWKSVNLFENWAGGKNGSFWFRRTLNLTKEQAAQDVVLRLGAMKDADSVFVNGKCVGNTTYEYPPRVYKVAASILREGENEIVIHLMSQSGRANFTKGKLYQMEFAAENIKLEDGWTMAVGCEMPKQPSSTYFVDTPTGLYNAMIAPLRDFPIRGMLWYQGESNQGSPETYADMFSAMVESWRTQWKKDFPVAVVQLAGYMGSHQKPYESGWTRIRHQQYKAAKNIRKAALVSILDTGEFNDIHPQDKRTAGRRAAMIMQKMVYGEKKVVCEAPMPQAVKQQGDNIVVTFDKQVRQGKDGTLSKTLTITPDMLNTVMFNIKEGRLRYCWDDYPTPVLFGETGIPVPQFEEEVK